MINEEALAQESLKMERRAQAGPLENIDGTLRNEIGLPVCVMDKNNLTEANAAYIIFAWSALPPLAREVIRLREENAELNEAIKGWEAAERSWTEIRAGMESDNAALRARVERLEAALTVIAEGGFYTKLHPDEDESPEVQNAYSEGVTRGYRDQAEFARQVLGESA